MYGCYVLTTSVTCAYNVYIQKMYVLFEIDNVELDYLYTIINFRKLDNPNSKNHELTNYKIFKPYKH